MTVTGVWFSVTLLMLSAGCSRPSATEAPTPKAASGGWPTQPADESRSGSDTERGPANTFKPAKPDKPPPIVVIMVDTLRADRLGVYGNSRGLTPTMDRWAGEGVVFEQAIAPAPWTLPSVASLFTGFYPPVHGANAGKYTREIGTSGANWRRGIPERIPTFIESLAQAGYKAYGVSTNLFVQRKTGFGRGFDIFRNQVQSGSKTASRVNRELARAVNHLGRPEQLLLYIHYMDVHEPYLAPAKYIDPLLDEIEAFEQLTPVDDVNRGIFREIRQRYGDETRHAELMPYIEYWEARYDGGVKQLDKSLQQLENILRSKNIWERAWVILLSDHGEALGEDDTWSHGSSARQHQLHVPLILRWPEYLPADQRITAPVSLVDVFPTLLDALDVAHPQPTQGRSLLPLIFGAGDESHPVFAAGVKRRPEEFAVIDDGWKLRFDPTNELVELYDLNTDPQETNNLARANHPQLMALKAQLEQHQANNERWAQGVERETGSFTPEELRTLQALGYLGEEDDPNAE